MFFYRIMKRMMLNTYYSIFSSPNNGGVGVKNWVIVAIVGWCRLV